MELVILAVQIVQVVVSILLILVVLLQPGKSGDLGSIFGGGTSESVFGAAGAVPFLAKLTRGLAVLFMVSSLALGYFAAKGVSKSVVTDVSPPAPIEHTMPATDETGGEAALTPGDTTDTGAAAENEAAGESEAKLTEGAAEDTNDPAEAQEQADTPPAEGAEESQPETKESTQ